jgi:hypothetical protein
MDRCHVCGARLFRDEGYHCFVCAKAEERKCPEPIEPPDEEQDEEVDVNDDDPYDNEPD